MKDRFRFRVWNNRDWDDEFGQVYYDAEEAYDYIRGNPQIPASYFGELLEDDQWIVEQCTGLKDKNGKLIYDGDILKISSNTDREVISPVVWDDEETGFCVKYKEELFRFNTYRKYHKLEIIGNIHQNQELLKESK